MRLAILALLASTFVPIYAQEGITSAIINSDVIVVGTLHRHFRFPWLDGWNELGHIEVEQTLKGDIGNARNLTFAWERDFRQGWCLTRPDWRGEIGKSGIWFLHKERKLYRAPNVFGGFLDKSKSLNDVVSHLNNQDK